MDSRFVPPTVILNPALDSAIMKEEIFGPVMLILPVQDIDEAIDFINERENPLALYYFGDDSENREKLRNSTSSGNFSVYECVLHYSAIHMPFGGVGNSGMGQYHGKEGFYNFSHPKSVLYKSSLNMYPLTVRYPPYTLPK